MRICLQERGEVSLAQCFSLGLPVLPAVPFIPRARGKDEIASNTRRGVINLKHLSLS